MKSRFLPWWVLFWCGVFCATLGLGSRMQREMRPSPVEMTVEWSDVERCATAWQVPPETLLRQLRGQGVRGVVCEFATLQSLADDGHLTLLGRAGADPLFSAVRRAPLSCSFVVATRDARLFAQLDQWLLLYQGAEPYILPPENGKEGQPPLQMMALALAPSAITRWPVGFAPAEIASVRAAGLEPVPHIGNSDDFSPALLEAMLAASRRVGARIWLPDAEMPGFRTLLPLTARAMRRHRLALGFVEADNALGLIDVAKAAQGWVVRGHAVGPSETARLQRGELLDRYARAARERNVRLLVIRLLRQAKSESSGVSARVQNLEFIADLKREITADPLPWRRLRPRLQVGLAQPVGVYGTSARKALALRFGAGLGVLGAVMLLLNLAFELSVHLRWKLAVLGVVFVLGAACSAGAGAKGLALVGSLVFPVVALLWSGLDVAGSHLTRRSALQLALWVLGRATGLSLAGGLIIAALLGDWTFHVKVADFWGTKAASVLPILIAGGLIVGDFWPGRVEQVGAVAAWKRLWTRLCQWAPMPFTLRPILFTALSALVVSVWLSRTGNDSGFAVSPLEWKFRALLESQFIARPRTKEFLLCHPALMLGVLGWLSGRRRLGCLLLLLGLIGQISVVNSFAQANNPLYIPLWRTLLSWGLASVAGSALVWCVAPRWNFGRDVTSWRGWKWVRGWALGATLCALSFGAWTTWHRKRLYVALTAPTPQASWPWPHAQHEVITRGVEHWFDASTADGTTLDLLAFDFAANKHLKFELSDSDVATTPQGKPPSNRFAYWNHGLGETARQLNRRGDLVAAWNGGFWGLLNQKPRAADRAFHLSPIVSGGRVFYPGINRRWTWGAKIVAGRPRFALLHAPNAAVLARDFDFATGTLQALLKDGQPLEVRPYPWFGELPPPLGLPSTPNEAGAISVLDHMHTSRVGAGWTPSGRLFVLVVKEPDGEAPSRVAVNARMRGRGGWTLSDHQRFWLALQRSFGVQNAVGLDGGDVAQAVFRRPDRDFTLLVPRLALPESQKATLRLTGKPDFSGSAVKNLHGGALNYFVVREN